MYSHRRWWAMNKNIAFGLFVILFLVFWNVLDFLFATFVTRNGYQFNGMTDLAVPLAAGVVLGYLFFLRK
jgi:hypothetical protein